jgi:hypothetical protein
LRGGQRWAFDKSRPGTIFRNERGKPRQFQAILCKRGTVMWNKQAVHAECLSSLGAVVYPPDKDLMAFRLSFFEGIFSCIKAIVSFFY